MRASFVCSSIDTSYIHCCRREVTELAGTEAVVKASEAVYAGYENDVISNLALVKKGAVGPISAAVKDANAWLQVMRRGPVIYVVHDVYGGGLWSYIGNFTNFGSRDCASNPWQPNSHCRLGGRVALRRPSRWLSSVAMVTPWCTCTGTVGHLRM